VERTVGLGANVYGIVSLLQQSCDLENVLFADQIVEAAGNAVEPEGRAIESLFPVPSIYKAGYKKRDYGPIQHQ
jgi:hypothetical protein